MAVKDLKPVYIFGNNSPYNAVQMDALYTYLKAKPVFGRILSEIPDVAHPVWNEQRVTGIVITDDYSLLGRGGSPGAAVGETVIVNGNIVVWLGPTHKGVVNNRTISVAEVLAHEFEHNARKG